MQDKKQLIDILGDVADFKQLIYAMVISSVFGLTAYLLAPSKEPYPLICGLGGLIISFVITNKLFKPKRKIVYKEGDYHNN